MSYYAVVYSDSLSHFGIKGQKWGVRRYQNEDGTLTPDGKRRYGILDRYAARVERKAGRKIEKAERKMAKAKFGFSKRAQARKIFLNKSARDTAKDFREGKDIYEKASALGGSKSISRNWERASDYYKDIAGTYKQGSKKAVRNERSASNAKAISEGWKKINEGKGSARDLMRTPIVNVKNGKATTYGKEIAKAVVIAYASNLAMNVALNMAANALQNN